ncbi:MAG: radical SAM protein [Syntrophotalea sp.]|uniref:B12-binding domain-containing radical SAM protein n=1 Tax=Syntrophotalea sp. TaxID=2812029 RepID=UPI003D124664
MKILLMHIQDAAPGPLVPPLGMACVAAAVRRAGYAVWQVSLRSGELGLRLPALLSRLKPDAIGLSVRNVDNQSLERPVFFLESARQAVALCHRYSRAPVIVGGAGFSVFGQRALDYLRADYGICGEGEASFVELLQRLQPRQSPSGLRGRLPAREVLISDTSPDLSTRQIPRPGKDLLLPPPGLSADLWVPFQTRRGCAMDCSYCATAAIEGRALRRRPVAQVVSSLHEYLDRGYRRIFFVDNTFNLPESYALALCEAFQASGLRFEWKAIVYPWRVSTKLVRSMAAAGCTEVSLGFESGSRAVLEAMHKRFCPEDVDTVSRRLRGHGIRRLGFLLLGGPAETRETVMESLRFADHLDCDALKMTVGLRIYPGTQLAAMALRDGIITAASDLLRPAFYLAPGLAIWLPEIVAEWMADRPHWS